MVDTPLPGQGSALRAIPRLLLALIVLATGEALAYGGISLLKLGGSAYYLIAGLAYLVLVNSLVSLSLLFLMLRHGEAAKASTVFFLVPPVAAGIAWVVLGATMAPLAVLGTGVAALGVALVVLRR